MPEGLSSRDYALKRYLEEGDLQRYRDDLATDLSPANIQELGEQLDRTQDPQQRAILLQEIGKLRNLAENLLGPIKPRPTPPFVQPVPTWPVVAPPKSFTDTPAGYQTSPWDRINPRPVPNPQPADPLPGPGGVRGEASSPFLLAADQRPAMQRWRWPREGAVGRHILPESLTDFPTMPKQPSFFEKMLQRWQEGARPIEPLNSYNPQTYTPPRTY